MEFIDEERENLEDEFQDKGTDLENQDPKLKESDKKKRKPLSCKKLSCNLAVLLAAIAFFGFILFFMPQIIYWLIPLI